MCVRVYHFCAINTYCAIVWIYLYVWLFFCTDRPSHVLLRERWVECDIGTCTHCDIHLPFQKGRTALMKASELGRMECVKVLLDRGADINMQDKVSVV